MLRPVCTFPNCDCDLTDNYNHECRAHKCRHPQDCGHCGVCDQELNNGDRPKPADLSKSETAYQFRLAETFKL